MVNPSFFIALGKCSLQIQQALPILVSCFSKSEFLQGMPIQRVSIYLIFGCLMIGLVSRKVRVQTQPLIMNVDQLLSLRTKGIYVNASKKDKQNPILDNRGHWHTQRCLQTTVLIVSRIYKTGCMSQSHNQRIARPLYDLDWDCTINRMKPLQRIAHFSRLPPSPFTCR